LDIITATRAGTATYTDASGNIQTASPNTVRVDHVDGVPMILVEPAATNLITYTDFSSGWVNYGSSVVAGSGLSGEESVIVTAENSSDSLRHEITTVDGVEYTGSFYIRRVSGVGNVEMIFFNSATVDPSPSITVTNEWVRVENTFLGRATGGVVNFGIRLGTAGDSVEIAMPQVEEGTVATSYIPTSGSAVTRAADDLVIDGSDFTDFYNDAEGTFYVESVLQLDTNISFIFDVNDGDTQRNILYYPDSSNLRVLIRKDDATSASLSIGARPSEGVLSRAAFGYATNNLKGSLDGGSVITDTSVTPPTTVNEMTIGSHFSLDDQYHLNGHIKRLIYWPYHSDNL
jgi:hypothetical protein